MAWFRQIIFQGAVIGLIATLLAQLDWPYAKIFLAVLLVFVLVMLGSNPLYFYRKIFRTAALASVSSLVLGFNAQISGDATLPLGLGGLKFLIDMGNSSPGWIVLILAICAAADFGAGYIAGRSQKKLVGSGPLNARALVSHNRVNILEDITIKAPPGGLTLTGARLRIRNLGAPELAARLLVSYHGGPQTDVTQGNPVQAQEGDTLSMSIDAKAEQGWRTAYLARRLRWTLFGLLPVIGGLALEREAGARPILLPVELIHRA
jgi:hypothetical protein